MSATILILEDDSDFATMLSETLGANEFEVEICLDPELALEILKKKSFDLLISDFLMPKQEGTSFIKSLRDFDTVTPVIMISAYMNSEEIIRAAEVGVTRVLKKPFETKELVAEIEKLIQPTSGRKNPDRKSRLPEHNEFNFPRPLKYLADDNDLSRQWVESLWQSVEKLKPLFLSSPVGLELELIVAEIGGWLGSEGKLCLEMEASDLFLSQGKSFLRSRIVKDEMASIVVLQRLESLPRNKQKPFLQMMKEGLRHPSSGETIIFVIPLEGKRLSLAEMAFDDELLEFMYANLISIPPLRGRYVDLSHYAIAQGLDDAGHRMNFSISAIQTILNYSWPGNYAQLKEVILRLRTLHDGGVISDKKLRTCLEKTLEGEIDALMPKKLYDVLLLEQKRFIKQSSKEKNMSIEELLKKLAAEDNAISTEQSDKLLLYPDLVKASSIH